jgi:FkbM family methyltransferase
MIDVPPGVQALPIPPLFDVSRYVVHDASAEIICTADALTVASQAAPWSYLVAWRRAESDAALPDRIVGWLIRVDARLTSGKAMLACVATDLTHIAAESSLGSEGDVDLVVGDLTDAAWLIVRRGGRASPETTVVSVHGLECFALVGNGTTWQPARPALVAVPRWSQFYGRPDHDLRAQIRYVEFTRLTEPRHMPWLENLEVLIAPREQMSQAVYVSGLYEPCTSLVLRSVLRDGDTFIDVGANVGWFSMLASRWTGSRGTVLSVEPSSRECQRLREHVVHNRLSNVRVLQLAAGAEEGDAVLHVADERHSGLNTLRPTFMYDDVVESYTEKVCIRTLDHVVAQEHVAKVHVIKIDVEGAEYDVLLGARDILERDRPAVIIEVAGRTAAPRHAGREAIERLLRSFGYGFAAIDADSVAVTQVDELTGSMENFVAAMPAMISELVERGRLGQ